MESCCTLLTDNIALLNSIHFLFMSNCIVVCNQSMLACIFTVNYLRAINVD